MAEAEDVIVDAARHATVFARDLWQRHRAPQGQPQPLRLADVAQRLDLLIVAAFSQGYPLRPAQVPAPPTLLTRLFRRHEGPPRRQPVPATDGQALWLPAQLDIADGALGLARFRVMALQQAMRAVRGSPAVLPELRAPLRRDLYLLLEAQAADAALVQRLPGVAPALAGLRAAALAARPPLAAFPPPLQALEQLVRAVLAAVPGSPAAGLPHSATPQDSLAAAGAIAGHLQPASQPPACLGPHPLLLDLWTGELRSPPTDGPLLPAADETGGDEPAQDTAVRSARLPRRPEVRDALDGEDEEDAQPGAWMVQTAQPHETAEDPFGLQRPVDRDEETSADEFADAVSELSQARLVATPGRPKEVLLCDDPPQARARRAADRESGAGLCIRYPEWDFRTGAYREPGATVHILAPQLGPQRWVDETLARHRSMLQAIRRRFEVLRARPRLLHRQLDGDELDLAAYTDSQADFRAGLPLDPAVYETRRRARRDLAILLLVDASGSTDGWIAEQRRVIDVEREALLLVGIALDGLGAPYAVHAFSGEGPHGVTVRPIKRFNEAWDATIAQRVAALEPDRYTRAGAAIRHATALLMRESAQHRLLLLLSDGKPNDIDDYEGRYGVEDMRQAVVEAKLQGIFPFCLTIDRHAANYLPAVFGSGQYALLTRPQALPTVLLEWMKRLVAA